MSEPLVVVDADVLGRRRTGDETYVLNLLRELNALVATDFPVLIGVSRKSFLGRLTGGAEAADRLEATLAAQVLAQAAGARIIRTHDVKAARRASEVVSAILTSN